MNKNLLKIAIFVGMLPATLLWGWGLLGFKIFFTDATSGQPFALFLLMSGFLGLVGIFYLYRLWQNKHQGNLLFVFFLLIPAWLGMGWFVSTISAIEAILISVGPTIVSLYMLWLCWPQLTKRSSRAMH